MNGHALTLIDDDSVRTLESVLVCLSGAVAALDRAGRVVTGNAAFYQLHSGPGAGVGGEFVARLRPEDHWLFYLALEKAAGNGRASFSAVGEGDGLLDVSLTLWRDHYFMVEVVARQAPSIPLPAADSYSEIPLRSIFDSSGTGLALVSLEGRWLRANEVICTLLGYSEAQLQRTTFMALTHPDDHEVGRQLIEELKSGARAGATLHKRYIHRDGRVVWGRLTVGLVRDDQGQPACFVSQLEDITENWQLRETLMGSELKFLTLAENSPNIIVRYDRNLLRTYVNPAYRHLTGKSYDEVIGVCPDGEASDYLNQLRRVVETGETAQFVDSWAV
ncbi:MAG: PAS domain S-box protein, partial [Pseudomonas sp.]|uniref:PAS domain S-box protein n=1 Tax=Pseudomonas sp. TaxID=306 RepID=UPI003919FE65